MARATLLAYCLYASARLSHGRYQMCRQWGHDFAAMRVTLFRTGDAFSEATGQPHLLTHAHRKVNNSRGFKRNNGKVQNRDAIRNVIERQESKRYCWKTTTKVTQNEDQGPKVKSGVLVSKWWSPRVICLKLFRL